MQFEAAPLELSDLNMYLKCTTEHSTRDPVVAYYCLLYAFQRGLNSSHKSPAITSFLTSLMDKLEAWKKSHKGIDGISNETVGISHVEEYALRLFKIAYEKDVNNDFGPATVKLFLTAGLLLDVTSGFGEIGDELKKARKYAKWKAVYITKCQKSGETPVGGPVPDGEASITPELPGTSTAMTTSLKQEPSVPPADGGSDTSQCMPDDLTMEQYMKSEKAIRCALSAITYRDRSTAITYLLKALETLQTFNE